jgi:hypothetical protein
LKEKRVNRTGRVLGALLLCSTATLAAADDDYFSPTRSRLALSLGVMQLDSSTSVSVDSSAGLVGTDLNGENELGLDHRRYEPKFDLALRAGARNRVFFDYFSLDRTGNTVLAGGPIDFGNVVLQSGYPVTTDLSLRVLQLGYGYSFWHGEKLEIAGILSINDTEIQSSIRVNTANLHIFDEQSLAGPFPTPGLDVTWAATKRFYFEGKARYLKLAIDKLQGSVSLYDLDAFFRLRPNIAFALGYSGTRADLVSHQARNAGSVDFDAKGPELFVRVEF